MIRYTNLVKISLRKAAFFALARRSIEAANPIDYKTSQIGEDAQVRQRNDKIQVSESDVPIGFLATKIFIRAVGFESRELIDFRLRCQDCHQ